ncbi:class I SAM-dependent methyltransferase [Falsiroseomonas sp. E2-1-a20]|uniref:class I SAM-dependent methyltransferase n=1 Tax=Falsiroseomonas sp. E2-1-a20 TaxID=3239300 RepID=UPI003F595A3C
MTRELAYRQEAAAEYDCAFSHVSAHFVPYLLRAARLTPGRRVLDVATGTGIAAEAALAVVGPEGLVVATDISPEMVEKARQRLGLAPNAFATVENGQALSFPADSFDAVLCSLGLMFFPDPALGLAEFRRVLRLGGRAAASVTTTPERSYNARINVAVARYVPSLAAATARTFSIGDERRLRFLFESAGFQDVEIFTEAYSFTLPSFDAYFGPFERGGGSSGQALVTLPEEVRRAVREDVRRELENGAGPGGPVEVPVEVLFGSGCK